MKKLMILLILAIFGATGVFAQLPGISVKNTPAKRDMHAYDKNLPDGGLPIAAPDNPAPPSVYDTPATQNFWDYDKSYKPGKTSADVPDINKKPGNFNPNFSARQSFWNLPK
jgi:hypothetical protein